MEDESEKAKPYTNRKKVYCGLPFRIWVGIEFGIEVICSILITVLSFYCWVKVGKPTSFFYKASSSVSDVENKAAFENCIILWSLVIILLNSIWRVLSAVSLLLTVKNNYEGLGRYWLVFKITVLMISVFVAMASFHAPGIRLAAIWAFVIDYVSSCFIFVMHPSILEMTKRGSGNNQEGVDTKKKDEEKQNYNY